MDPILIFLAIAIVIIAVAILVSRAFRETIAEDKRLRKTHDQERDQLDIGLGTAIGIDSENDNA